MGDAFPDTIWGTVQFYLFFIGVPTLIFGIPLAVIALFDWRILRRLRARADHDSPPTDDTA
jgi:uncharacterized iron-regulated membrane protein